MNESQHDDLDDNEQFELLDRITQQFREQPIPPQPKDSRNWIPKLEQQHSWKNRLALYWIGVAAALLLMLGAAYWAQTTEPQNTIVEMEKKIESERADNVQTLAIVLTDRLDDLEQGLDELDGEIAALKRLAELLDARRKAESLMNAMAGTDGFVRAVADES